MKKLTVIAALLLGAVLAFAQPTLTLNPGYSASTSRNIPLVTDATNRYGNSGMLYRSSFFVDSGATFPLTLTGIAFELANDPVTGTEPAGHQLGYLRIYIRAVTSTDLNTMVSWDFFIRNATLVYQSNTVDLNGPAGWRQFTFNQNGGSYTYDGTSNLLVTCLYDEVKSPAPTSMGVWKGKSTFPQPGAYLSQNTVSASTPIPNWYYTTQNPFFPKTRFTLQAPAYGFILSSVSANTTAAGGSSANYTITITNEGQNADSYSLAVAGNNWPTTILDAIGGNVITTSSSIPSFSTSPITITVHVPLETPPGQTDNFTFTATSVASPALTRTASLRTTTANYGPVLTTLQPNSHLQYDWIDPVTAGHTEASYTRSFYNGGRAYYADDAFSYTLGESFNYFGTNYNTVGLGTDFQCVFAGTNGLNNSEAIILWGLDCDVNGVIGTSAKIYTHYDAMAHKTILTWINWPQFNAPSNVYSAQLILDHSNGSMKVQYHTFPSNYSTVPSFLTGPRAGLVHNSASILSVVNRSTATINDLYGGGTMTAGNAFQIFRGNPTFMQNPTNPGGENSPGAFVPYIPGDPNTGGTPPIGISFPPQTGGNGNPGSVTVSYSTTRPPQVPAGSLPVANTIGRYFTISTSSSNFVGATLRLRFTTSDLPAGITDPLTANPPLQAAYSVDGGTTWTGFTNTGTVFSLGGGVYEFVITDLNHFSMWAIGNQSILPVTLSSFTASPGIESVTLNWRSESETNNASYRLYRSETGEAQGAHLTTVRGAGNSATAINYQFVDHDVQNGRTYYYRLTQVDVNGTETLLPIRVSATPGTPANPVPTKYRLYQNFPNPFNATTQFAFDLKEAGVVTISIFDVAGRQVATVLNEYRPAGHSSVEFNATNLPAGIYFAKLQTKGYTRTRKLALVK